MPVGATTASTPWAANSALARQVEAVRHENDPADVLRGEDLCRSHGVLMRVARLGLRPAHRYSEFALECRAHQFRFGFPTEDGPSRHQNRQADKARDPRTIANAL